MYFQDGPSGLIRLRCRDDKRFVDICGGAFLIKGLEDGTC